MKAVVKTMLTALTKSGNELTAERAKTILNEGLTPEQAIQRWHPGSFLTAVLRGDLETAKYKADSDNLKCIINL